MAIFPRITVGQLTLPTSLFNNVKTVATAGSRVALASSTALSSGVRIKALATNTGTVYVGNSGVSSANGYQLAPGDEIFLEVADLATVYLDASADGQGVSYVAS